MKLNDPNPPLEAQEDAQATNWEAASAKWCASCGRRITDDVRRARPGVQTCEECNGQGLMRGGWKR